MRRALITGITGQDGSYLAEFLLEKGYTVHGIIRRTSTSNLSRIAHLCEDKERFFLHQGDLGDSFSLKRVVDKVQPHEIYNLAAMSHVKISFETPEITTDIDGIGTIRLLEAVHQSCPDAKFYQASTSELFGMVKESPQDEETPFHPRSPYGIAKLLAYWTAVNYREAYGMFTCNGILFNHESPRRSETFVTRKITMGVAKISRGLQEKLILGNLDTKRDWGYAVDYVKGMWMMLQQNKPSDYVLATGRATSVRQLAELAFKEVGIGIEWQEKRGIDRSTGKVLVEISPEFFRPAEVDGLIGNATKAKAQLGWEPKTTLEELVRLMVQADLDLLAQEYVHA